MQNMYVTHMYGTRNHEKGAMSMKESYEVSIDGLGGRKGKGEIM